MKKILLLMLCIIFLVGTVSALELRDLDDVKYYDEEITTYTLENFFGLGKTIADLELKTPQNNKVGAGYQKVAEIEIKNGGYDYKEIINGIELQDRNDDMKEIIRDIDYKYKTIIQVPNYETICVDKETENKTVYQECSQVEKGTKDKIVWKDFTKNSLLKGEVITLGLFTEVKVDDKVEWILNVYGNERLTKWAEWTHELNTDIYLYFKYEETSGWVVDSIDGFNTNTTTTRGATGKIGNCFEYENVGTTGDGTYKPYTSSINAGSMNFWLKTIDTGKFRFFVQDGSGNPNDIDTVIGSGATTSSPWCDNIADFCLALGQVATVKVAVSEINDGDWHMVTITVDGTTHRMYVDAVSVSNVTSDLNIFGGNAGGNGFFTGATDFAGFIDEWGFWNRSLTVEEVIQLWNGGTGITYETFYFPIVNLNTPIDYYNSSSSLITFNGTVYDYINLTNVTLIIDGIDNETNSSGINNTDYIFTKTLSDGTYNWTMRAFNNNSKSVTATVRTFSIDTINPVVNITYPINITYSDNYVTTDNKTIQLNWSSFDANLDTCWYYNTTANVTITCNDNATIYLPYNTHTFFVYANDTSGRLSSDNVTATWIYKILENSYIYNNESYKTKIEEFSINVSSDGSQIITANLVYNGTSYPATKTGNNVLMEFNETLVLPVTGSISFYWNFTHGTDIFSSTTFYQNVNDIVMGACSAGATAQTLNFTAWNEEDLTNLSSYDFYGTFEYWLGDGNIRNNFSISNTSIDQQLICINLTDETYYSDAKIQYEKTGFVKRSYYLINETLTNITSKVSLYLLNTSSSTSFIIEVKDEVQLPIKDVYVYIQRYYPGTDQYKTVEMALTDNTGSTIGHFEAETEDYRLIFEKNEEIIYQSGTQKIFCRETPCTLTFQIVAGAGISWDDFGVINLFNWTLDYDEGTEVWTLTYIDTSDSIGHGRLYVYYEDPVAGKVTICNTTSSQIADTITCDVTGYNGTIYAAAYLSRSPEILVYLKSIVISALKAIFGLEGLFLSMFILLALAMAGLWNPAVGIILIVIGMIVLTITGLASFGATAIWSIIFVALIILWKLKT